MEIEFARGLGHWSPQDRKIECYRKSHGTHRIQALRLTMVHLFTYVVNKQLKRFCKHSDFDLTVKRGR